MQFATDRPSQKKGLIVMAEIQKDNLTFEQALARLEVIVKSLENGTAPLDDSLSMFEEGISLVRFCSDKLVNAENKIKVLVSDTNGNLSEQNFGG